MATDDETFDDIVNETEAPVIVSITQREEEGWTANYDVDGTDDLDVAIAATVKGLFAMCLDAMGFWEVDEEDEFGDES